MLMQHGESIHSPFPWDLPLWMPDHVIFFGFLYAVVFCLALGLGLVFKKTFDDMKKDDSVNH